jgi:site-specific DNA recombinase
MEEIISKEEYLKYVRDYDVERKKIESEKEEVLDKIESQKELDNEYDEWVEAFKDYINIEELTRDIVVELIEKIEVNADGSINIHYRFNNPYSV